MGIQRRPHGYEINTGDVIIKIKNMKMEKNSITCFLHARRIKPVPENLLVATLNLTATRSVQEVAKTLEKQDGVVEWTKEFPRAVAEILYDFITPAQPVRLSPAPHTTPSWFIKGIVPSEQPTIVFAPGGTGKSFLSLFFALICENGINDFFGEVQRAKTLYLDWEADTKEMERRLGMLVRGLSEIAEVNEYPHYVRMYSPLCESLDYVLEIITGGGYRFIVIDSAACAVGGDMNDSAVVIGFSTAINKIISCGVTPLIVSHVSKAEKINNAKKSPIGSVQWENFARVAWELRSERETESRGYRLGLFCSKSNVGPLDPVGFAMEFHDNAVYISRTDVSHLEVSTEKETITSAILSLLAEKPLSPKDIAKELEIKPASVHSILTRLKQMGKVVNSGYGRWMLKREAEEEEVPF